MDQRLLHPRHWPTWVLLGLFHLIGLLPFPLLWALGMGLGHLAYFLVGSRRRVALRNLAICFPDLTENARGRLAARHFGYLGGRRLHPRAGGGALPAEAGAHREIQAPGIHRGFAPRRA